MAKDKMKKKGTKRLSNGTGPSWSGNIAQRQRQRQRGNRPVLIGSLKRTAKSQQARYTGRVRQGNPSPGIRRQLGAGIRDARQIINSHQGAASRRMGGRPRAVTGGMPQIASSAFSDAVRAAIAPIVAPLLRQANAGISSASRQAASVTRAKSAPSGGPCLLRVANLAQSVTISDLSDLFKGYAGFTGADMDSPGIAVVAFDRTDSALTALDEYNNRELDGRTMMIQLDTSVRSTKSLSRLGPKPSHV